MSLKENIKRSEGFRDRTYLCTQGIPTIGYGFRISSLTEDELAHNNGIVDPMPRENAEKILDIKLEKLKKTVLSKLPWLSSKPEEIQDVVFEMGYQLGINGLLSFKNTLKLIQDSRYREAADNMLLSKWAKQTPNRVKLLASIVRNFG